MLNNDMFYYNILVPILLIILLIINILLLKKKNYTYSIKRKYINLINKKNTYQEISYTIRSFISEISNNNIMNYSLKDIKKINNKNLTNIIEECYKKEFSQHKKGNINNIKKDTKELIKTWK